jgi:hypothetical protein
VRKLVQNKIDRAKAMIDARKNSPAFHIDYWSGKVIKETRSLMHYKTSKRAACGMKHFL